MITIAQERPFMPFKEFVVLMVLLMSMVALSIDSMLPALGVMGRDLSLVEGNQAQYIISFLFFGLMVGQIFFGPLSDSFGRKPMVYIGLGLFSMGSLLSLAANSFELMLFGRVLQGFGAASPRVLTVAMIRDRYSGREMAQVMSIIMSVFILVPAIAPSLGQFILWIANWRSIFLVLISVAAIGAVWMHIRLAETLRKEYRSEFKVSNLWSAVYEVISNRLSLGYTICAGFIFGGLIGYISSAQQVFQEYYDTGDRFPIYFATLALAVGVASMINAKIVTSYGMRAIIRCAFVGVVAFSIVFSLVCMTMSVQVPLAAFMVYAVLVFFCFGLLFGNLNTIAMEPMGHIAGAASAVIGALSSAVSLVIGTAIGQMFNMTLLPLAIGFLCVGIMSIIFQQWAEREGLFRDRG